MCHCFKNSDPCSCGGTCNNCQKTSSDNIQYIGPNLPITTINFNDTITAALQKIELAVSAPNVDESNLVHIAFTETITGDKTFTTPVTAAGFVKTGGLSTQFLKADGSVDSNVYATNSNVVHLDGTEIITGAKTFAPPVNSGGPIIEMPLVTSAAIGVPDAFTTHTRGHNIAGNLNRTSGHYLIMEGDRNIGVDVTEPFPPGAPLTNSIGYDVRWVSPVGTNIAYRYLLNGITMFSVSDGGRLYSDAITYRMGINYSGSLDDLKTPGFYWGDDLLTGGPTNYINVQVYANDEDNTPKYHQVVTDIYPGTNRPPKMWTRISGSGGSAGWSPWALLTNVSGVDGTKIYEGQITQSSGGAPSVGVLSENTLGAVTWSRTGPGVYLGTLTGAFTAVKVIVMVQGGQLSVPPGFIYANRNDNNSIIIRTYNLAGNAADDIIGVNGSILIKTVP